MGRSIRRKKMFVCPPPPAPIFDLRLNFFFKILWQNWLFSVAKTWWLLSIRFLQCVQSHWLYPSSYMLCTISLWTTHLVDFPATIAKLRWSILCLNSKKKKTSAHPPPFSNLCGGQTDNLFLPYWAANLFIFKINFRKYIFYQLYCVSFTFQLKSCVIAML